MTPKLLLESKALVFDPIGFELTNCILQEENSAYSACKFELNGNLILFRYAKITPTKIGQFVTIWKRTKKGPIAPYEKSDNIVLLIVCTKSVNRFGQFVFPQSVLAEKGIISTATKAGKRALRVYPPWDIPTSKQAQKTQDWQLSYFIEILLNYPLDLEKAKKLYAPSER